MSIKILRKGLPVLGRAVIGYPGAPRQDGKQAAPVKLDHFEVTQIARDANGRMLPDVEILRQILADSDVPTCGGCDRSSELADLYNMPELGERGLPTALRIMLPYDDPEVSFPNKLAWHRGSVEFCSGDGVEAQRREEKQGANGPEFGERKEWGPCGNACPNFLAKGQCKPKGRLRFLLAQQKSVGGIYEYRTTSWASIANIQESLESFRAMTGGALQWIPLTLSISEQRVQPRSGAPAGRAQIARLTYEGNHLELLEAAAENLRLRAPVLQEIRRLEAGLKGDPWTEEELADFRAEFEPDHEDAIDAEAVAPEPEPQKEPDPQEEPPAESEQEKPEAPAEKQPQFINKDQAMRIWRVCEARAVVLSKHASKKVPAADLLRAVLDSFGVKKTEQIPRAKFGDAMTAATNAKVPS